MVVVVGALWSVGNVPLSEPAPAAPAPAAVVGVATVVVVVVAPEVLVVATAPSCSGGRVTGTVDRTTGDDVLPMGACIVVVVNGGDPSAGRCSPGRTPSPEIVAPSPPWPAGTT